MNRIPFLDSHTGGEPTRLIEKLPFTLAPAPVSEQLTQLQQEFDHFRTAILNEPRGSDVLVGAYLVQPADPTCQLGVIFFNNVGYLGMCGHGTIGLMASLAYRGQIEPGTYRLETPVGIVQATLHPALSGAYPNRVSVRNVPAYRLLKDVAIEVDGRTIHGDVAWGGNWFFLCHDHQLEISPHNLEQLTDFAWRVREAYNRLGLTAPDGHEIDHVELFGPSTQADSRSFVLCPGRAYDRSPCGTGTSAKLACLVADGRLREGQVWRQQSVIGSIFEGSIQFEQGNLIPTITGEAWVMAEGDLLIDERDPFGHGIGQ
ncbi:MAG: hydroxyproline-2-epimerase [Anaerolineae bacterium]|nr:MAG: hydroxyproline-2-epimerase [Anaerolineae bacterium]